MSGEAFKNSIGKVVLLTIGGFVLLAFLGVLFGSWFTIDQTERGVILRNGAFSYEAQPGLGFKLPLIDSLKRITVQTQKVKFNDLGVYSLDQQPTQIGLSVIWRVDPTKIEQVYSEFKDEQGLMERIIVPLVNKHLKVVFGQYTAYRSIQERAKLTQEVEDSIKESTSKYPVIVESIQLEDITFSKAYENSVEQRMLAEVEVQKLKQNAERQKVEAEIQRINAEGQANAIREVAQAEAMAIQLKGEAEAKAIEVRAKALERNQKLVALVQAERWDGKLPTIMLPNQSMPILNLGRNE